MFLRNFCKAYKKGLSKMSKLYDRIQTLCEKRGVSITTVCRESGASRASLSDLKMGRKQSLSAETLSKLANWFGVSVDFLLGKENASPDEKGRTVSEEDIKFALFGGDGPITDEMYREVMNFAAFVKRREEEKQRKD